ncbi:hypothetical protein GTW37_30110 [Streptomyces sp. SID4931]|nr:hypothetical protein [Streptomyces sp. SID4931]
MQGVRGHRVRARRTAQRPRRTRRPDRGSRGPGDRPRPGARRRRAGHRDSPPTSSLCHGLAGRIAVLCHLADLLARPDLRDGAAALHTAFLDRYGNGGWSCGIGTEPLLPSYFLGLSGWFAAQAMLDHPGTGLPRCLGGR